MITKHHKISSSHTDTIARDARPVQQISKIRCPNPLRISSGLQRLSVIIPTYNEEKTIGHTLDRVHRGSVWEVIVVDGRSTDQTREIASRHDATVVESLPGRARQLTLGASVATGDTLLFLHADTSLPLGFEDYIFNTLNTAGVSAGAFRLLIDAKGFSFRLIEKIVNLRSRIRQMPYGDQAIFVPANVFHEVDGYPDIPIMEDYAIIRRLRRLGRIEIAPANVITSARRWINQGVWRTTLSNQICIAAYRLGVSPDRIARWRERLCKRERPLFNMREQPPVVGRS